MLAHVHRHKRRSGSLHVALARPALIGGCGAYQAVRHHHGVLEALEPAVHVRCVVGLNQPEVLGREPRNVARWDLPASQPRTQRMGNGSDLPRPRCP